MRALIFAAGMGTRLKPLTDTLPKALIPVCGKPLLEHLIEKLKEAGFCEIVINVHHFAQKIRDFVREKDSFGIDIFFSDETDLLRETGGGIRHAAALLNDGEPFLVHNVDILSNLDIRAFYETHLSGLLELHSGAPEQSVVREGGEKNSVGIDGEVPLATLLVSQRETDRYLLFDSDNNLVAWMNIKTGEVKSPFVELQREAILTGQQNGGEATNGTPVSDAAGSVSQFDYLAFMEEYQLKKYAFAGIHVISPSIFKLMSERPQKFSIIGFYLSVCNKYPVKAYPVEGLKLVDVGKLDSLQKAEHFFNKGYL